MSICCFKGLPPTAVRRKWPSVLAWPPWKAKVPERVGEAAAKPATAVSTQKTTAIVLLLIAQSIDRIKFGCAMCGIESKKNPCCRGDAKAKRNRLQRYRGRPTQYAFNDQSRHKAEDNADRAPT